MNIELAIFDMDGVIFEGDNFWLELHQKYGTEEKGLELAHKYLFSDYENLATLVAKDLWKGKPVSIYNLMINSRVYQPGVKKVFRYLNQKKIPSAILSSGPYHLASRAQGDLGINAIWANRLSIENNILTGEVEVMVRDHDKKEAGLSIIRHFKVSRSQTVFIGDSDADVGLAEVIGLPISYNSKSEKLNRVCKYVLKYGELEQLINILSSVH